MSIDDNSDDVVTLTVDGHLGTVAFNRPHVLNACNLRSLTRLIEIFDEIDDRDDIWCVILKGNGRSFCVGADQKERKTMSVDDIRLRRRIAPQAFSAMRRCARPVIGQVHGFALGGGLEMAMGCDVVVAAADTSMGMIETLRGSIPAGGGTQLLPRLVGPARAKELIFTGRKFSGADAERWGLVTYSTPPEEVEATATTIAHEILCAAPIANVQAKRAINMSMDLDLTNGVLAEAALYERAMNTSDRVAALAAYHAGTIPTFEGK